MNEPDAECSYCKGFRFVESMVGGTLACRVCLGTGGAPYDGELGGEARARELRRIGELLQQVDRLAQAMVAHER